MAYILFFITISMASAATTDPTYESIQKTIQSYETAHPGQTMTIPMVLESLPESFRAGYALMHTSRSIQGANPQAPRVIMFGQSGRTVMAFNGSADQAGYNRLEFALVNPQTEHLEFRMMTFPGSDTGTGRVAFSEANPTMCTACHGATPHYIWGNYANWPGAYGESDDVLQIGTAIDEVSEFSKFKAASANDPRYKTLVNEFAALSTSAPYREYTNGDPKDRGSYQVGLEVRPNARFSMLAIRNLARSRIREISAAPMFSRLKYAFAFYLGGCQNAVDDSELKKKTGLSNLETIAAKLGSIPTQSWHFELAPAGLNDYYPYYSGFWTLENLMSFYLWQSTFTSDPDLKKYFQPLHLRGADAEKAGLTLNESGKALWDELDDEGQGVEWLAGSDELKGYVNKNASTAPFIELCRVLVRKQGAIGSSSPLSKIVHQENRDGHQSHIRVH